MTKDECERILIMAIGEFSGVCMRDNPKWVFPSEEAVRITKEYADALLESKLGHVGDEESVSEDLIKTLLDKYQENLAEYLKKYKRVDYRTGHQNTEYSCGYYDAVNVVRSKLTKQKEG